MRRRDLQPHVAHQCAVHVHRFLLVFLFIGVKPDKRNICIRPKVVLHKWADDVPADGDCQSLGICRGQVMPDFVVGLGLCIASTAAV